MSSHTNEASNSRMERRAFLGAALGGALATQASVAQTSRSETGGKAPNFVFILFDKCRRDAIGAYGRSDVHTPNMDKLAAEGVRFDACYAPQALCGPCRASIITGKYPHEHGLQKNVYPFVPSGSNNVYQEPIPAPFADPRFDLWANFPYFLNAAGYATGHIGKWHLGSANPGFFDYWKGFNSLMLHWLGEPYNSPYRPEVHTDLGIKFIEEHADEPFFLYQSYYSPHEPNNPPKQYYEPYEGKDVEHVDYYATVTGLDHEVGRIVETLRRKDLLDNTFIIITTEHGKSWEDRPGTYQGMSIAYDDAARLPLIMHCPSILPKGITWKSGVSSVDIMPTIMHAAGLYGYGRESYVDRSLLPDIQAGRDEWSRTIVIENISQKGIEGMQSVERALRTKRWKLILRDFPAAPGQRVDELYDMENDPDERRNLFASKTDVVKKLAAELAAWGDEHQDPLAIRLGRRAAGDG